MPEVTSQFDRLGNECLAAEIRVTTDRDGDRPRRGGGRSDSPTTRISSHLPAVCWWRHGGHRLDSWTRLVIFISPKRSQRRHRRRRVTDCVLRPPQSPAHPVLFSSLGMRCPTSPIHCWVFKTQQRFECVNQNVWKSIFWVFYFFCLNSLKIQQHIMKYYIWINEWIEWIL